MIPQPQQSGIASLMQGSPMAMGQQMLPQTRPNFSMPPSAPPPTGAPPPGAMPAPSALSTSQQDAMQRAMARLSGGGSGQNVAGLPALMQQFSGPTYGDNRPGLSTTGGMPMAGQSLIDYIRGIGQSGPTYGDNKPGLSTTRGMPMTGQALIDSLMQRFSRPQPQPRPQAQFLNSPAAMQRMLPPTYLQR
jgi:hypothetical protein